MREHVKVEVAMEILSMCTAIAISNNDKDMNQKILRLKKQILQGDMEAVEETIEMYGEKVKKALEDTNE